MMEWVVNTIFTAKFGSESERYALTRELVGPFNVCVNPKSGIYLVRLARVKDLRDRMKIDSERFPEFEFDNAYVYKYGRSTSVIQRFCKLCIPTSYGGYSKGISLTYFALIPESHLVESEASLRTYFEEKALCHRFEDACGHNHTELVVLTDDDLGNVRARYIDIISKFPPSANELALTLTSIEDRMRIRLELAEERLKRKLAEKDLEVMTYKSKAALAEKECELLRMQLQHVKRVKFTE